MTVAEAKVLDYKWADRLAKRDVKKLSYILPEIQAVVLVNTLADRLTEVR